MSDETEKSLVRHKTIKQLAANNVRIDQISTSLREMLTAIYSAGLGDVVIEGCTKNIEQLMRSENVGERLIGSFALLGMTRTMASVGETIIADQKEDTP